LKLTELAYEIIFNAADKKVFNMHFCEVLGQSVFKKCNATYTYECFYKIKLIKRIVKLLCMPLLLKVLCNTTAMEYIMYAPLVKIVLVGLIVSIYQL